MPYHPDLSTTAYFITGPAVRAVGWLSKDHPFPTGPVPPDFLERLRLFTDRRYESAEAFHWGAAGGFHTCELCHHANGHGEFAVPTPTLLFVAPHLLLHYVTEHHYRPPQRFITALLASPLPGTPEYTAAALPFQAAD